MNKKNKSILDINFFLLIIGSILILITSLYLFTRPAIWKEFNFSETGEIGDTIGGITAPIVNLIGAILIFISFKAQIKANRIQFRLLNKDIKNQKFSNNFQVTIELFKELKTDYNNFTYDKYTGQGALNVYVNAIKSDWDKGLFVKHQVNPIYFDWKFLMAEYDLIITHLTTSDFRDDEMEKLFTLVQNFYIIQLEYSTDIIVKKLLEYNLDDDLTNLISNFQKLHTYEKKEN